MRNGRRVETRRDRKALARDAGMGRTSTISVLAGALCGLAALEILIVVAGALGVAINGGTNFAATSDGQFKAIIAVILVAELFVAFLLGGYVSGRMSRRRGATHGLLAGVLGVILAALAALAVVGTGTDNGLARVARHISVADTWHQWRSFGLIGMVVAAAAVVVGALAGGVEGERWHGKLQARAVDPSYGPEAEQRAEARKRVTEAEVARLAAADHVGRLTGASKATSKAAQTPVTAGTSVTATEPAVPAAAAAGAAAGQPVGRTPASRSPGTTRVLTRDPEAAAASTESPRGRHFLGRG